MTVQELPRTTGSSAKKYKTLPIQNPTGGGAGPSAVDATTSIGIEGESITNLAAVLAPQSIGTEGESLAFTSRLLVSSGSDGESLALANDAGVATIGVGTDGESLALPTLRATGLAVGTEGESLSVSSLILGKGFVATGSNVAGNVKDWTNPTRVQVDDASYAQWTFSVAGLASGSSSGTVRGIDSALAAAPSGFARTKVETLIHFNTSATGLAVTGDSARFAVDFRKSDDTLLQVLHDVTFTAASSDADQTKVTDVTAVVAALTDAQLAATRFYALASATFGTLGTGTRAWTINIDSLALRVTYTKAEIT